MPHHLPAAHLPDQQFYHNLYNTSSTVVAAKKFDLINNNSHDMFTKDVTENTRRFSVNNLLKTPTTVADNVAEKSNGESINFNCLKAGKVSCEGSD